MTTEEYLRKEIASKIWDKHYYQQKINEEPSRDVDMLIVKMNIKGYQSLLDETIEAIEHLKKAMIAMEAMKRLEHDLV